MQVDYLLFFGITTVQDFTIVEEAIEKDYYWRAKKRKYMGVVESGLRIKTYARLVRSNFSRYIDMYDYMDASSNYWKKGSKSSTC